MCELNSMYDSKICYFTIIIFNRIIIGGGEVSWQVDSQLSTYLFTASTTLLRNWKLKGRLRRFSSLDTRLWWCSFSSCWQVTDIVHYNKNGPALVYSILKFKTIKQSICFLILGTIGFFACFWFTRKIYSVVKVD